MGLAQRLVVGQGLLWVVVSRPLPVWARQFWVVWVVTSPPLSVVWVAMPQQLQVLRQHRRLPHPLSPLDLLEIGVGQACTHASTTRYNPVFSRAQRIVVITHIRI